MTITRQKARREFERFFSTLFLPDEFIELRFIESWVSHGKKKSRVVRPARWLRRRDVVSVHGDLTEFARRTRANVYFGVCPRSKEGDGNDRSVNTVRCVWCDIDNATADESQDRWKAGGIPRPSVIVISGSGIHGYWLLEHDLTSAEERSTFALMLRCFYRTIQGDHVQNLSRVLRPPGTVNYKDAGNGRRPLPCRLYACDPELRYPLETFSLWFKQAHEELLKTQSGGSFQQSAEPLANDASSDHADVATLIGQLDKPARDRSRRDFAIVCDLLRLGLAKEQIWSLVSSSSKFESNGRPYFDLTITNAASTVLLEETTRGQLRAPA